MNKIKYIFLFLFFAFLGKLFALPVNSHGSISFSKESKFFKVKKDAIGILKSASSKVNRQKRPKKPKGIQVIVPNVSSHAFHKFCSYSEYAAHEVKGNYSLLLHYSHGKRGPPSKLIQELPA